MSLYEVKKLSKTYMRGGKSFNAVNEASLTVEEGDFVNIVGKSGSGKTTLLSMMAGLLKATSGEIIFGGKDMLAMGDRDLCRLRNRDIGFIPQGNSLLSNLSVFDNVRLPVFMFGGSEIPGRADFLLDKLGIGHLAHMYPQELSGGELRRAAIARALMNEPKIIIADEPTSDLDAVNTKIIMELLVTENKEGTAVLTVTHELENLAYGSQTYIMSEGGLAAAPLADKSSIMKQMQSVCDKA